MILARRVALVVAALLVVVIGIALVLAVTSVRRPFPVTEGEVSIPGLSSKVSVLRDDRGIPQIYADNAEDLMADEPVKGFAGDGTAIVDSEAEQFGQRIIRRGVAEIEL